jgi:hypothetical protein
MRALFPVIHYRTPALALSNAHMAADLGCAGVFLINMDGDSAPLLDVAATLRATLPTLWLGVNRLDRRAADVIAEWGARFDGVWTDNAGLHSMLPDESTIARCSAALDALPTQGRASGAALRFFGAVAFKGQRLDPNPAQSAVRAVDLGWTPTTSGPGTGIAPDVAKLAAIRAAIAHMPGARLAVASGITPENVTPFFPFVDDYLVATGIGKDFYTLDPVRVADLQRRVARA